MWIATEKGLIALNGHCIRKLDSWSFSRRGPDRNIWERLKLVIPLHYGGYVEDQDKEFDTAFEEIFQIIAQIEQDKNQ